VVISAAGISECLVESELFGHERGSFTGANMEKTGLLELANHGTVFFDEIAEMSLPFQAKILSVVDGRRPYRFRRVGGLREIESDFNIICASNRPIEKLVEEKKFLQDLFFRLQVFPIYLPPLRERKEDIIALVRYYLEKTCEEFKHEPFKVSTEAWAALVNYGWPGNVRELMAAIVRVVALCGDKVPELKAEHFNLGAKVEDTLAEGKKIDPADLEKLLNRQEAPVVLDVAVPDVKKGERITIAELITRKDLYIRALEANGWQRKAAAKSMGLKEEKFIRHLKVLRIAPLGGWSKKKKAKV